jgi:hypothetical protein
MDSVAKLNADVTQAILDAEAMDHEAAASWERVAQLEAALYAALPAHEVVSLEAARRGVQAARAKARARREHQ